MKPFLPFLRPAALTLILGIVFLRSSDPLSAEEISASFAEDSEPLVVPQKSDASFTRRDQPWSMSLWVKPAAIPQGPIKGQGPIDYSWGFPHSIKPAHEYIVIGGIGSSDNAQGTQRMFIASSSGVGLWDGQHFVYGSMPLVLGTWQFLAATFDGKNVRIYQDGRQSATGSLLFREAAPTVTLSPILVWGLTRRFVGEIADFHLKDQVLTPDDITKLAQPDANLETSHFPLQPKVAKMPYMDHTGCPGLFESQDPRTLPKSFSPPVAKTSKAPAPPVQPPHVDAADNLVLNSGWKLVAERRVTQGGAELSRTGINTQQWFDATVPGTILTTLVEQGVYPDPYFGLNNLLIPDDLCQQDWWYRTEFATPAEFRERTLSLQFLGVNYVAEVWLNGTNLGSIKGIGVRGIFDVSKLLLPNGTNALAVKIIPPPHPGTPVELSLGFNNRPCGGWLVLDGPTFFASEDWDWIPGIRDRDIGLWQDVVLTASDGVTLRDPFVKTTLPLPDLSRASLTLVSELHNATPSAQTVHLRGKLENAAFDHEFTVPAGGTVPVNLDAQAAPAFTVPNPRLWWPNGYGKPELYTMALEVVGADGRVGERKTVRFGIRQISVTVEPHLLLKINGQPIFIRGGSWGMDDAMKRVSKARLEPYVRLQRDANLNSIRLWCGQSLEQSLLELCDEYGIMIWSEFWMTTTGVDYGPQDADLMEVNLEDAIRRFRTHPCIVAWQGRNEGWPSRRLNDFLVHKTTELDGTRHYQAVSNGSGIEHSGPWNYLPLEDSFKKARGFRPEIGMPSLPTADGIRAMMPAADTWPISDTWAYHDFPQKWRNGYVSAIKAQFGPSSSLDEFCRKAQMISYEGYRGIFEGAFQKMFKGGDDSTTGIHLWMTHPAWPSMIWQLYDWRGEALGAFYGAMHANEHLHVQMSPVDGKVVVVNHGFQPVPDLTVTARVFDAHGAAVSAESSALAAPPSAATDAMTVSPSADPKELTYVRLDLRDRQGKLLSENFYRRARDAAGNRAVADLPKASLTTKAKFVPEGNSLFVDLDLQNAADVLALMVKITARDAATGKLILPAYYSDNYVTVLGHETKNVRIELPGEAGQTPGQLKITVEAENVELSNVR